MNTITYILIALLWLAIYTAISFYILGKGMTAKQQFSLGLKSIFISFLVGLGFLFFSISRGF